MPQCSTVKVPSLDGRSPGGTTKLATMLPLVSTRAMPVTDAPRWRPLPETSISAVPASTRPAAVPIRDLKRATDDTAHRGAVDQDPGRRLNGHRRGDRHRKGISEIDGAIWVVNYGRPRPDMDGSGRPEGSGVKIEVIL